MTRPGSLVARAHAALAAHLGPGDTAVDATVGGGGDTLVLARAVGDSGRVHGFDVQLEALDRARRRLEQAGVGARVELHPDSHADLARVLPARLRGALAAAVFNLGYLPGGDERLTTRADSTLAALHQLESWLAPDGALSLIAYVGQSGGAVEADAVGTSDDEVEAQLIADLGSPVVAVVKGTERSASAVARSRQTRWNNGAGGWIRDGGRRTGSARLRRALRAGCGWSGAPAPEAGNPAATISAFG